MGDGASNGVRGYLECPVADFVCDDVCAYLSLCVLLDAQQLKSKSTLTSTLTSPGAARQLVTFFCFAKKKVTKEKATPIRHPFGIPCVCSTDHAAAELALRAQTVLADYP